MGVRLRNWGLALLFVILATPCQAAEEKPEGRRPVNEKELRTWLENMFWHHRFQPEEAAAATGLSVAEVKAALERWGIRPDTRPKRPADEPLLVLPYPGGRHPRIGFLEGALHPQRETKVSIFTPWDQNSYVVADIPEAIWCQHGLLYLAHTHIDTVWTRRSLTLERLEWKSGPRHSWEITRTLPNKVAFGATIVPLREGVRMDLWLRNGSEEVLKDLRVQNCVMLKGAPEFAAQTRTNKVLAAPYAAARSATGPRWVVTAWEPNHRAWDNPPCPCIHSDPKFPDCPPGETRRLRGWLSFFEGEDIQGEFRRLNTIGWREGR